MSRELSRDEHQRLAYKRLCLRCPQAAFPIRLHMVSSEGRKRRAQCPICLRVYRWWGTHHGLTGLYWVQEIGE